MATQTTEAFEPDTVPCAQRAVPYGTVDRAALSAIRLLFDRAHYLSTHADVAASGIDPLDHFLTCGLSEGRSPCVLFDPEFYLGQPGAPDTREGLFLHYLKIGIGRGLDPHPLVMAAFYAGQAPRLQVGVNPLTHMLGAGRRENRRPNPLFDAAFYTRRLRGETPSQHPLIHYAQAGWRARLQPHPLFDLDAYLAQRPDIEAAGIDPLAHYLRHGRLEATRPNWLFDAGHYAAHCPDRIEPCDALLHFASHGSGPGRSPSPLFDAAHYLHQHPDLASTGADPFLHFLEFGLPENRDPHPLFDTWFYRNRNDDVVGTGIPAFVHYVRYGAREGRDPNPWFPAGPYLERHPEAAAEAAGPLAHFLRVPEAQRERLCDAFDPAYYLDCHPGGRAAAAAGVPPLSHYLATGRADRLSPRPLPLDRHGWRGAHPPPGRAGTATPILLVLQDASRSDAALCALRAVREMAADPALACRVAIRQDGALVPAFAALAPTLVVGGPHDGAGTDRMAELLYSFRDEPGGSFRDETGGSFRDEPGGVVPGGIVIVTSAALGDVASLAGRLRLRLLAWLHEMPISIDSLLGGHETMRSLAEVASRIVTNSEAAREALLRHYALPPQRVVAIADGVAPPPPGLDAREAALSLRERLELPPDALVVLGSGAIDFRNGTDLFVRVAAQVVAGGHRSPADAALRQAYFLWTGSADDRLFVGLCRNDIERLGLSDRVRLLGPQDEPAQMLLGADLFLQTAREPVAGVAGLEARSSGLPVIGFSGCGDDAATPGSDRLTEVPYLDLDAMAGAVMQRGARPARRTRASLPRTAGPSWAAWHLALRTLLSESFGIDAPAAAAEPAAAPPSPVASSPAASPSMGGGMPPAWSGPWAARDPLPMAAAAAPTAMHGPG